MKSQKNIRFATKRQKDRMALGAGDGELHIYYINVGQGDCTAIVAPNGKKMIIDAGTVRYANTSVKEIREDFPDYSNGAGHFDVAIMTHRDRDHYSLFPDLFPSGSSIDTLYHSDELPKYALYKFRNWWYKNASVNKVEPVTVNVAHPGKKLLMDGTQPGGSDCFFYCLASNVENTSHGNEAWEINTRSLVVMCEFNNDTILFCGDATTDTEEFMNGQYAAGLKSTQVRVGHHGSPTSSGQPFVDFTDPKDAIISVAPGNSFNLPKKDILDRWLKKVNGAAVPNHELFYYDYLDPNIKIFKKTKPVYETGVNGGTLYYTFDGS